MPASSSEDRFAEWHWRERYRGPIQWLGRGMYCGGGDVSESETNNIDTKWRPNLHSSSSCHHRRLDRGNERDESES